MRSEHRVTYESFNTERSVFSREFLFEKNNKFKFRTSREIIVIFRELKNCVRNYY